MSEPDKFVRQSYEEFVLKTRRLLFKGVEVLGDLEQIRLDDEPESRNRFIVIIGDTMLTTVVKEMVDAVHKLRMFGDDVTDELETLKEIELMLQVARTALHEPN